MLRGGKGTFYLEGLPATCHRAYFDHVYFGPQYVSLLRFCLLSLRMQTPRVETCVVAVAVLRDQRTRLSPCSHWPVDQSKRLTLAEHKREGDGFRLDSVGPE